jgi:hypothetical protein
MTDRARRQLAALARVDGLLTGSEIEYWLFGGWAVDFHAGTVTRDHDDVDLAVWLDDLAAIGDLLEGDGWAHAPEAGEDGGTGYERDGVRLELTFLVRVDDGAVYVPFHDSRAPWFDDARESTVIELHGTRSRVVSFPALGHSKSVPRDDPHDGEKDRRDDAVLRLLRDPAESS